jgi:signal transduction histidine kinase
MKANIKFRNLILSKDLYLESRVQYKRSILTGLASLLMASIGLYYCSLNVITGGNLNFLIYLFLFLIALLAFYVNRVGKQIFASTIILSTSFVIVFYFSSVESSKTGVYLFYINNTLAAFALLGYEKRKLALLYSILSIIAFQLAYIDVFNLYDYDLLSDEFVRTFFKVNFVSSMLATTLIVYFLMNVNYHSENVLKESENKLREKNDMLRKANDELDRFVYSTSHDLKAPLSSILGLVNIAEKSKDLQETSQYLQMMKERISTMDGFIKDITDYSRNNRAGISTEQIALLDLVEEVLNEYSYLEGMTEIQTKFDIPPDLIISSDRTRLKIIISNLINNSIKYRDNNRNPLIEVTANKEADKIILKIRDNGQGIKAEQLPKIFDMFYRASENSKGSGLGLYIVKEAVEKLGAKISVSSDYGKGTSFSIEIPNKPRLPISQIS